MRAIETGSNPCPSVGYRFGLDPSNAAAQLRAFANDIESGQVLLQTIAVNDVAPHDDWHHSVLTVKYVEQAPVQSLMSFGCGIDAL